MIQDVENALELADTAQRAWAARVPRQRFKLVGRISGQIANAHQELLHSINRPNATDAQKIASEIFPLADACRFTAKAGRQTLAPRSHSSLGGAWWMGRIGVSTTREPWGTILILGPSNYPLFLPGVQIVQALAAGNAVVVKPAPGGSDAMECFKACAVAAGIPADLLQILPTTIESGQAAMKLGVDKVVLTGSVHTGRAVLRELAKTLTPSTMELSGCDAVFVTQQANIPRVAKAINFALRLNGGATCIAPRRIFVTNEQRDKLTEALLNELKSNEGKPYEVASSAVASTRQAVEQALAGGASIIYGSLPTETESVKMQPIVLTGVTPQMEVAQADLFAPITSIIAVRDMPEAVSLDERCPYSLSASVFGPKTHAEHWATVIQAGCVVINDIIVPTADPRVSFGGHDQSGWGVTRGAEGLLEMTRQKTVCVRRGNWLPHLDKHNAENAGLLIEMLKIFHAGSLKQRYNAFKKMISLARIKPTNKTTQQTR